MLDFRAMTRAFLVLIAALWISPAIAQEQVRGLDHVPVVVRDLDKAAADFEALGFALKPGRPRDNGLRNLHAKFPDGTEIELVSPAAAIDALSRRYVDWLKAGDGPVAFGLYVPDASATFRPSGFDGVFLDRRQRSPTDRPEHFAHPNGATSLVGVWLAGHPSEQAMRRGSIGTVVERQTCAPFGISREALVMTEGELMFLPEGLQRLANRPIVALTVSVRSLDTVRPFAARRVDTCARKALWAETHGMWLEFLER